MNPLALLNPGRWLLYLALAAALVAGYFAWANHIGNVREDKVRGEYAAQALVAEQAARAREQALQSQVKKAQNDAQLRQTTLIADATRVAAVTSGLRNQLATTRASIPKLTRDAVNRYADAASDVFEQCSRAYSGLAGQADAIASERQTLIDAWPK